MRPNVLQLVPSFDQGGSERQAIQLARLLHESGRCRVRLATLSARGVLRAEAESLGAGEIEEFPLTSFHDANFVRQLRRFRHFLRANEIDVVQTHDFYTNVFGMLGAALARVPARLAAKRETAGMRTRAQALIELQIFRHAHRVVVNSDAVARKLKEDGVRASKIVTVYNGLDAARVSVPAGANRGGMLGALGLPEGRRFVTVVANLRHEVKDIPTFLRAAARVRERARDAAFVVAGEGPLEEPLRSLAARLGISEAVFFVGRCARVAELLRVSDVCVLSSVAEGFSNSILEYMAAARAVVATDVGGAREAVVEGSTGHLVTPGDDEALAARVASLLEEPSRARAFGEAGRARVASKFSCEAQLENTLELYRALLAREETAPESRRAAAVEDARRGGV
ncbi:MAG TPA: glycosyltransferase [Pyrinomonadaceae bacterium]|nr:glycosyltransferase [Pyrinomonadaceae bacterium]